MNRHYDTYMLRDMMQDLDSIMRPYIGISFGRWVFESVERKDPRINVKCVYSTDGKITGILVLFFGYRKPILVGSDDVSAGGVEHRPEYDIVYFGGLGSSSQKTIDRDEAADRQYKEIQKIITQNQQPAHKFDGAFFWSTTALVAFWCSVIIFALSRG